MLEYGSSGDTPLKFNRAHRLLLKDVGVLPDCLTVVQAALMFSSSRPHSDWISDASRELDIHRTCDFQSRRKRQETRCMTALLWILSTVSCRTKSVNNVMPRAALSVRTSRSLKWRLDGRSENTLSDDFSYRKERTRVLEHLSSR